MKIMKLIAAMVVCCGMSGGCVAEEVVGSAEAIKSFQNQGFVKGAEKEILKNKFPACDDFLNIEWINSSQGVGYVKHDLYKDGKLKGEMESLVFMRSNEEKIYRPYDRLELYTYRQKGEIDELFDAIKNGKVTNRVDVVYKDYVAPLRQNNIYDMTYADNTETVCIPYENLKRAWILESKSARHALTENEVTNLHESIIINGIKQPIQNLYTHNVLDINGDGKKDLYLSIPQYFFISLGNKYEYIRRLDTRFDKIGKYLEVGLDDKKPLCEIFWQGMFFITTDGSAFYINNQCNINEITDKLGE